MRDLLWVLWLPAKQCVSSMSARTASVSVCPISGFWKRLFHQAYGSSSITAVVYPQPACGPDINVRCLQDCTSIHIQVWQRLGSGANNLVLPILHQNISLFGSHFFDSSYRFVADWRHLDYSTEVKVEELTARGSQPDESITRHGTYPPRIGWHSLWPWSYLNHSR